MARDILKGAGDAIQAGTGVAGKAAQHAGKTIAAGAKNVGDAAANLGSKTITPEQMQELLNTCYGQALDGIPGVSKPLDELVDDYISRFDTHEEAAKSLIANQLVKCTTSGFLSGLTGFLVLPVTLAAIPANIANVLYVQLRMAAAVAKIGGYDTKADQVQTFVFVCLAGQAAADVVKEAGVKLTGKLAQGAISKIPGQVLININKAVGFRLATKAGETGIVNLSKLVPFVGAVVGGLFDFGTTKIIADNAYKQFIDGSVEDVVKTEKLADEAEEVLAVEEAAERKEAFPVS